MNKHFDEIPKSDWLTKQDRDDFARYISVYSKIIGPNLGHFDWNNDAFKYFCKTNKIQSKGTKVAKKKENHFWFNASKDDYAHHFLRHIRNAFAHSNIEINYKGKKRNKFYVINDYDINGVQTMNGNIRSDLLWEMIWLLFQSRI